MRAIVDPARQFRTVFADALLYIDFFNLIARERDIEAMQGAVTARLQPLGLIEEVTEPVACAEEQPMTTAGAGCDALLQKAAKRREPGSGPDHDDIA